MTEPDIIFSFSQGGIIWHEIGHALGLLHEQARTDRDRYVEVLAANVYASQVHNYNLVPFSLQISPYDYDSVMHYEDFVSRSLLHIAYNLHAYIS